MVIAYSRLFNALIFYEHRPNKSEMYYVLSNPSSTCLITLYSKEVIPLIRPRYLYIFTVFYEIYKIGWIILTIFFFFNLRFMLYLWVRNYMRLLSIYSVGS